MSAASLLKAIKAAGGVTALATRIGIKPQAISQWRRVPAERLGDVVAASGISASELRPDLAAMFAAAPSGVVPCQAPAQPNEAA